MAPYRSGTRTSTGSDLGTDRNTRSRWARARNRRLRSAALILSLLAATPAVAQNDAQSALEIYGALREPLITGELTADDACLLRDAIGTLHKLRVPGIVWSEAFEAQLLASESCGADADAIIGVLRNYCRFGGLMGRGDRLIETLEGRVPDLVIDAPENVDLMLLQLLLAQGMRQARRWDEALEQIKSLEPRVLASPARGDMESTLYAERVLIYQEWGLLDLAARWNRRLREALDGAPSELLKYADLVESNLLLAQEDYAWLDQRVEQMLANGDIYPPQDPGRAQLWMRTGIGRLDRARTEPRMRQPAQEAFSTALAFEGLGSFDRANAELYFADLCLITDRADEAAQHLALAEEAYGEATLPPNLDALRATLIAALARRERTSPEVSAALVQLENTYRGFLEDWKRIPMRRSGLGLLAYQRYLRMLSELILMQEQIGGDAWEARAFEYVLEAHALSSLARTIAPDQGSPTLAQIRSTLCSQGHGVLVWIPAADRSHLFLLDDMRLEHVELEAVDSLRRAQRLVLDRYMGKGPADGDELAMYRAGREQALIENARLLLPPSARDALRDWTHVTLVGSELLGSLPFEDLPLGSGATLGDEVAVAYLGSLAAGVALAQRAESRPARDGVIVLVNGTVNSALDERYGPLADFDLGTDDVHRWLDSYPGTVTRTVIIGASPDHVREASPMALLQIVAHGVADLEQERPAALVLAGTADEGLLRCDDVDRLPTAEVVVLTACDTEQGPQRRGDGGAADFGGAFLLAGASSVIVSPFPLELGTVRRLMAGFHEQIAHGASPSEALRVARRVLGKGTPDPSTDGGALMRVVGLGHRPVFAGLEAPSSQRSPVIGTVLIALLATGLVLGLRWRKLRG